MNSILGECFNDLYNKADEDNHKKRSTHGTEFFNETWMLRLVLKWFDDNRDMVSLNYPLKMLPNSHWFSEGLMGAENQVGENGTRIGTTQADGIIGDFEIKGGTKGKIEIQDGCKQFVVIESKMGSDFSKGTKNAPRYNQVVRSIACICGLYGIDKVDNIGFYAIIPKSKYEKKTEYLKDIFDRKNIERIIMDHTPPENRKDDEWSDITTKLIIDKGMKLRILFWEEIIKEIGDIEERIKKNKSKEKRKSIKRGFSDELNNYYTKCKKHNNVD